MSELAKRLRSAREAWVEIGAKRFLLRRPRRLELALWSQDSNASVVIRCLAGWEGVTHDDIFGNGDVSVAPFAVDLADEWLLDTPDVLLPLIERLQVMIREAYEREEGLQKN